MKKYLDSFNALSKYQSAYREFHSVETALTKIYDDLIKSKAGGKCSLLILLDLSAAFDTVNHDILLQDLRNLGINGQVWNWFKSYLTGREFIVEIEGVVSERGIMCTGVPQGSILGPVLFIIYTIELQTILGNLNVSFHFCADDTQIYLEINDIDEDKIRVNLIYQKIKTWMSGRRLKLNSDKTECMLIGSRINLQKFHNIESLQIDNNVILFSPKLKRLGVIFDQELQWQIS